MCTRHFATYLFIAFLAIATGCDGTDEEDDDQDCRANATMMAQIGSYNFNAVCVVLILDSGHMGITGITNIDGSSGSEQHQISISLPGANEGTFPAMQAIMTYATGDDPANLNLTTAISGQLVVQELSAERVRGTFSFSGPEFNAQGQQTGRTVSVTNGQFNIQR